MKQTTKAKKKTKKSKKVLKIFLITSFSLIFLGIVVASGIILAFIKTAPTLNTNEILDFKVTSVLYDDNNNAMDDLIVTDDRGQIVKRTVIDLKDTSPYLGKAFVAIEDKRFYKHKGVDYRGITRAVFTDVKNKVFRKNESIQGASTITQQLIKNRMFLKDSLTNRLSYKRKVQEAYLSTKLEKNLSKDEILEAYMNTIFLGGTAHGVEAASNQYFSKPSKELTLIESAFIAGIAQSPTYFYPFANPSRSDPSIYLNKTKLVLSKMYETKVISQQEYDQAINELNSKKKIEFNRPNTSPDRYAYEWFSRPVVDQIKKDLMAQYQYSSLQVENLLMNGGLKIYTTMNKDLQDKAQNILNTSEVFERASNESKNPLQSSAVIMDYHDGKVKAIIGGRDEKNQPPGAYNRAANVSKFHRPIGSSIKPLTVYAPAIDTKQATPSTIIEDTAVPNDLLEKYNKGARDKWVPHDDDNVELGAITIREAITRSRNLVAVRLEDKIGLNVGFSYAEKFGLKLYNGEKVNGKAYNDKGMSALSLGQLDYGTNTLAMSAAYGVFGNSGMYAPPRLYNKVVDKTGKTLLETKYITRKAIEPQTAYIMWDLLKGPTSKAVGATGPNAAYGDMPVAGKTGTTGENKDLWFCGLTPYYSAAVWIGNDDRKAFGRIYSNDAALLWGELMKEANANLPVKDIEPPAGMHSVAICRDSGKLATALCSQDSINGDRAFKDVIVSSSAPTEICDEHIQVKINKTNNKLATDTTPAEMIIIKVFLRKDVPKEKDDTKPVVSPNNNNNNNKNNNNNQPGTNTDSDSPTINIPIPLPKVNLPKIINH